MLHHGYQVLDEFSLSQQPRRIDVLAIRREEAMPLVDGPLRSFKDHLGEHSLLEFKGPTDDLEASDIQTLLAYGLDYMTQQDIADPARVRLFTLSDHLPASFRQRTERLDGRFHMLGEGLWRVEGLIFQLFCIEAAVLGRQRGEHLLYPFCRAYLRDPGEVLPWLEEQEKPLFFHIIGEVEQFKKMDPAAYEDYELFEKSRKELLMRLWDSLPEDVSQSIRQKIVASLSPEERLSGLRPEERLSGLRPEERLSGLRPEDMIKGLSPEDRARLLVLLKERS